MAQLNPQIAPQNDPQINRQNPDVDRADTSEFAWGTLVTGLLIGGIAGYLLANSSRTPARKVDDNIRPDRVA